MCDSIMASIQIQNKNQYFLTKQCNTFSRTDQEIINLILRQTGYSLQLIVKLEQIFTKTHKKHPHLVRNNV